MTTRFNARPVTNFGVSPLPTGYIGTQSDLTIPSVGIEDVDVSVFTLFNEELGLTVNTDEGTKKVPVIFAAGEKWAMIKRGQALRDRNKSLILPLITIGRSGIQQVHSEDQSGRGINQQVGELTIMRRLSTHDRSYQNLINRLLLANQSNLAVNPATTTDAYQLTTERSIGDMSNDPVVSDGGSLRSNVKNNVHEFISIPTPQFFTAPYEVTIWTQYTTHMNQIIETLISSFLPQGNAWKLETKKGYWFIATVDGNLYSPENNFDDMSMEERIIKYKFSIKVPAYILASKSPGVPIPVKRYMSSPDVSFKISDEPAQQGITDPFLGSDDPTLPTSMSKRREDGRNVGGTKLYDDGSKDPALSGIPRGMDPNKYKRISGIDKNGKRVTRYVRIASVNSSGETSFSTSSDLSDVTFFIE